MAKVKTTPRDRMIETARQYQIGTYINRFVAKDFQQMIRAEAASRPAGMFPAVVAGRMSFVFRATGQCACVTCGAVKAWRGEGYGQMETGHFLAGRRASIVLDECNVAPQCSHCNKHLSGNQVAFRLWMESVRGVEEIERLEELKRTSRQFTREELVDMRLEFRRRLRGAEAEMIR